MSVPLLATKLYIPQPRPNVVLRSRLIAQLNEGRTLGRKLTLISAPAGFGKTTLVSEWISALTPSPSLQESGAGVRAAWLSLDEEDSDLSRFLTYLVTAMQTIMPQLGAGVLAALQSSSPPDSKALITTLLNELTTSSARFILVLDDYHTLDSRSIDEALAFLIDHLPPQVQLVITTREDPQLPLARLRARGQLTELRAADLRFTATEAAEFLTTRWASASRRTISPRWKRAPKAGSPVCN